MTFEVPIWNIQVEKEAGGERWVNRYGVTASTSAEAQSAAMSLATFEREFHVAEISFTVARVSTAAADGRSFVTVPLGFSGARAGADRLPLADAVRVDFPATFGYGVRKFYHCGILEVDNTSGVLTTVLPNLITTAYGDFITPDEDLFRHVTLKGVIVGPPITWRYVTHHQFNRKWARRTNTEEGGGG